MESGHKYVSPPTKPPSYGGFGSLDFVLRVLLFVFTLVALILMVSANETSDVTFGVLSVKISAKYDMTPANIYFVTAVTVVCLYSILSAMASKAAASKPTMAANLLLYLIYADTLMLGVLSAATGAAGAAAYIGLRGNSHAGWMEVCSHFHPYCKHIGSAVACSLIGSIFLLLLTFFSARSLWSRVAPS